MTIDRAEATRRGQSPRKTAAKPGTTEKAEARRFVQTKTVVMMSDAFRACDYSARCVFQELSARLQWASGQSEPINNGRLWLSREEWQKAGFAPATVTRAVKQLIKVGLLYRSRAGGIGRGCSEYALTCYAPTKDSNGLFFNGFRKDAWAKYTQPPKKTRESKVNRDRFKNDELPPENSDYRIKSEPSARIISVHQEAESTNLQVRNSCCSAVLSSVKVLKREEKIRRPLFGSPFLIRRQVTADRGITPRRSIQ